METLFNQNMEAPIQFVVNYQSGAGLRSLWETIEHIILFHHISSVESVISRTDHTMISAEDSFGRPRTFGVDLDLLDQSYVTLLATTI